MILFNWDLKSLHPTQFVGQLVVEGDIFSKIFNVFVFLCFCVFVYLSICVLAFEDICSEIESRLNSLMAVYLWGCVFVY